MKFARVGVAIAAAAIVVTACGGSGGAGKDLKVGITLPLSGSALASAGPADKGARLAIKDFKLDGYTVAPLSSTTPSTASMTRSRVPRT